MSENTVLKEGKGFQTVRHEVRSNGKLVGYATDTVPTPDASGFAWLCAQAKDNEAVQAKIAGDTRRQWFSDGKNKIRQGRSPYTQLKDRAKEDPKAKVKVEALLKELGISS